VRHPDEGGARFLRNGITSQKIPFFIATAVKTSNLTCINYILSLGRPSDRKS
jgi:hypothetical protein